jgi:hypothetical protein
MPELAQQGCLLVLTKLTTQFRLFVVDLRSQVFRELTGDVFPLLFRKKQSHSSDITIDKIHRHALTRPIGIHPRCGRRPN